MKSATMIGNVHKRIVISLLNYRSGTAILRLTSRETLNRTRPADPVSIGGYAQERTMECWIGSWGCGRWRVEGERSDIVHLV